LDYSWFVILPLIFWMPATSYYLAEFKNWPSPLYWCMGAVTAMLLFAGLPIPRQGITP
jgi:hypothetical protein